MVPLVRCCCNAGIQPRDSGDCQGQKEQANAEKTDLFSAFRDVDFVDSGVCMEHLPVQDDFYHGGWAIGGELRQREDRPAAAARSVGIEFCEDWPAAAARSVGIERCLSSTSSVPYLPGCLLDTEGVLDRSYFPMQNVEKMRFKISSAVVPPVMASMGCSAA